MIEAIEAITSIVWDFREKNKNWWKTPDKQDSLRYALTEAAEAMDAWLREKRQDDLRNHDCSEDGVLDELADCAIMLVTAMDYPATNAIEESSLERLALEIASALHLDSPGLKEFHARNALSVVLALFYAANKDIIEYVQSRLRKIEAKVIREQERNG